jgi:RTX calcium-binding nonapeptide repeat (4 copies)
LGINFGGDLGFNATFEFGYDSHGMLTGNAVDGFFISQAQITPYAELKGGPAVNLIVVEFGGEAGLRVSITFSIKQPSQGAKVRESDINNDLNDGPYGLFNFSGKVEVFFDVYLKIGIDPFSTKFTDDLGDFTLIDFGSGGEPPSRPQLATLDPNTGQLTLNMGPNAGARGGSNNSDGDENFRVTLDHNSPPPGDPAGETVDVAAFGWIIPYAGVKKIYAEGGEGKNTITVDKKVTVPVELYATFNPRDQLSQDQQDYVDNQLFLTGRSLFNTWDEQSYIQAGGGDATLYGGQGHDVIIGGPGQNEIHGGLLNGSGTGDVLIGGSGPNVIYSGTPGFDPNVIVYHGGLFRLVAGRRDGDSLAGFPNSDDLQTWEGQYPLLYGNDEPVHHVDSSLVAGTGQNDIFFGGSGKSTYAWQSGDGDVSIYNFNANWVSQDLEITSATPAVGNSAFTFSQDGNILSVVDDVLAYGAQGPYHIIHQIDAATPLGIQSMASAARTHTPSMIARARLTLRSTSIRTTSWTPTWARLARSPFTPRSRPTP